MGKKKTSTLFAAVFVSLICLVSLTANAAEAAESSAGTEAEETISAVQTDSGPYMADEGAGRDPEHQLCMRRDTWETGTVSELENDVDVEGASEDLTDEDTESGEFLDGMWRELVVVAIIVGVTTVVLLIYMHHGNKVS